jgi:hypothetical protein
MARGVLAVLGSGETAPGMTKVHRELLARLKPAVAVNLDSVYGFQENVPQMSEKLETYFDVSLHTVLTTLHFSKFETASELERTLFKQEVRQANYVFAGPGSPSYALAQWTPLDLGSDLISVLDAGGTLCFASAAALTLGAFTAPIYEIYKVGADPFWLPGLNLMANLGLNCVVIPHFDNNEGGNYDTRFCYLGERRLECLERQLPDGVATLGVDEHTALILDRAKDTVTVIGRANGYWRLGGVERVLEKATTTPLAQLRSSEVRPREPAAAPAPALGDDADHLGHVATGGGPEALEALAALVRLARRAGQGHIDPAPLIEGVLVARRRARIAEQYRLADDLRDALKAAGVDVNDGPDGSTWSLR